jgi:tritrans,polycis-undecaprenyl-diphosphate synthase [geranylgeranyl-diphosphate specific]
MHIGVIPDGNRRFMKKKGIASLGESYGLGINKFYDFLEWCIDLGVDEVTVYALSSENLENRGALEIKTLLSVFSKQAKDMIKDERIHRNKVIVRICGDKELLERKGGKDALAQLEKLEEATKSYRDVGLNLAVAYGGRQEILNAAKLLAESGKEITEAGIKDNLWINDYPDIIIRTSERRISNFLTWQSAYSEIYFIEKLWQEFGREDLEKVLAEYKSRERRYGK